MNRRKAIASLFLVTGGGATLFGGYKWFQFHKTPDMAYAAQHLPLLSALAETIIPATDTPGAAEAGVGQYIYIMLRDCTDRTSANRFVEGLKEVQAHCNTVYGKPYTACNAAEQDAVMHVFADKGKPYPGILGKVEQKLTGRSFYSLLKDYTVHGYCSSQKGATQALAYDVVPGPFQGLLPYHAAQKAWATK